MITIDTPVGPFTMAGNGNAVTAAGFYLAPPAGITSQGVPSIAVEAVRAYFDGDIAALTKVPVEQHGTDYLEQCWTTLHTLTTPITYTELAKLTGRPGAVRAAAQGCARNQVGLFTPCHRVLRTDGTLGGYRWGVEIKRWLLKHEAANS